VTPTVAVSVHEALAGTLLVVATFAPAGPTWNGTSVVVVSLPFSDSAISTSLTLDTGSSSPHVPEHTRVGVAETTVTLPSDRPFSRSPSLVLSRLIVSVSLTSPSTFCMASRAVATNDLMSPGTSPPASRLVPTSGRLRGTVPEADCLPLESSSTWSPSRASVSVWLRPLRPSATKR
jgi:hypothetical protein